MKWSFAKSKIFSKCQRKWYYFDLLADPRSKNPLMRDAYLLKQLQSISAWRGSLVDMVIERVIVPRIRFNNLPQESQVLDFAKQLMDKQIAFGRARGHRNSTITKSGAGDAYCAFYDLEYNGKLDEEELKKAKEDIIVALKNLLNSNFLKEVTMNNSHVIAQRSLTFQLGEDITVSCTPDMIVFFEDEPPLIVDWKVHSFGNADAWLQLGTYAVALSRVKPHIDFPKDFLNRAVSIHLIEYQLLKNKQREYSISSEDIADIDDYIFRSSLQMKRLVDGYDGLDINRFQTAHSPETCEKCQFKKLCWERTLVQKRLFEE